MLTGHCLCAAITFSLKTEPAFFYRCHCSLCRRQTGTGYNCATVVREADFQWQAGQADISTWQKPSGYRNDFCRQCGSTVPNALRGTSYVWVPLGLLNPQTTPLTCIGDYCLSDATHWDTVRSAHGVDGAIESLDALLTALQIKS